MDWLILSPILSKIDELDTTIQSQEEAIVQSLLIVTQEDRIQKKSKQYTSYLSNPLPEEKEVTAFLKEVENIAKRSAGDLVGRLALSPIRVPKIEIIVRIAVRPTVYSDSQDIALNIKTSRTQ